MVTWPLAKRMITGLSQKTIHRHPKHGGYIGIKRGSTRLMFCGSSCLPHLPSSELSWLGSSPGGYIWRHSQTLTERETRAHSQTALSSPCSIRTWPSHPMAWNTRKQGGSLHRLYPYTTPSATFNATQNHIKHQHKPNSDTSPIRIVIYRGPFFLEKETQRKRSPGMGIPESRHTKPEGLRGTWMESKDNLYLFPWCSYLLELLRTIQREKVLLMDQLLIRTAYRNVSPVLWCWIVLSDNRRWPYYWRETADTENTINACLPKPCSFQIERLRPPKYGQQCYNSWHMNHCSTNRFNRAKQISRYHRFFFV